MRSAPCLACYLLQLQRFIDLPNSNRARENFYKGNQFELAGYLFQASMTSPPPIAEQCQVLGRQHTNVLETKKQKKRFAVKAVVWMYA